MAVPRKAGLLLRVCVVWRSFSTCVYRLICLVAHQAELSHAKQTLEEAKMRAEQAIDGAEPSQAHASRSKLVEQVPVPRQSRPNDLIYPIPFQSSPIQSPCRGPLCCSLLVSLLLDSLHVSTGSTLRLASTKITMGSQSQARARGREGERE